MDGYAFVPKIEPLAFGHEGNIVANVIAGGQFVEMLRCNICILYYVFRATVGFLIQQSRSLREFTHIHNLFKISIQTIEDA